MPSRCARSRRGRRASTSRRRWRSTLVALARATREHPGLERGASTRAVLSLTSAARARALWDARDFVIPQDVADLLVPTLAHRVVPRGATQGLAAREEASALLETVLGTVPPPR